MAVRNLQLMKENYWYLALFTAFTALYLAVLYLQANASVSYQLSKSHFSLLPNGYARNAPFTFSSGEDIYNWMNKSLINNIWVDPVCGNGICESPQEYPSWGDDNVHGCQADCGIFDKTTNITAIVFTNFDSEADMNASYWNLCMNEPFSACWFAKNQTFSALSALNEYSVALPDGNWSLNAYAKNGGLTMAIQTNEEIISYGFSCDPRYQNSDYATCRQACSNFIFDCLYGECRINNFSRSGAFLYCLELCRFNASRTVQNLQNNTCQAKINYVNYVACNDAVAPVRNTLAQGSTPYPTTVPRTAYRTALWEKLGPTDEDRRQILDVAVHRSLNTWVRDECLVHHKKNSSKQDRLTAFFCTFFGGPTTMEGCFYTYRGANLTTDSQLFQAMEDLHAKMRLAQDQVDQFSNVLLWALQSVTRLDQATVVDFSARLRQLDPTVVNETGIGCETADKYFQLHSNTPANPLTTRMNANGVAQWIWKDDQPHSVLCNEITLEGFGAHDDFISRGDICTPENIGTPCNLVDPLSVPPYAVKYTFSFTDLPRNSSGDLEYSLLTFWSGKPGENAQTYINVIDEEPDRFCNISTLADGKCNKNCNSKEFFYDGGDCACPINEYGEQICSCQLGQIRSVDFGKCCDVDSSNKPFILSTYGLDYRASNSPILFNSSKFFNKVAAVANRVLVGLHVQQVRKGSNRCKSSNSSKFSFLNEECMSEREKEKDRFGINPYALQSSSLFDSQYSKEVTDIYSKDPKFHNDTFSFSLNTQNIPYGFYHQSTNFGFSYIFDIGLNNSEANVALTYLKDGIFLDENVDSLHFSLITYNSEFGVFTTVSIDCTFEAGGSITMVADSRSVAVEQYRTRSDWIRCALEIVLVVAVAATIWIKVHEYATSVAHSKSFIHYFNLGNSLDLLSIALMVLGIVLWIHNVLTREQRFTVKDKYNMYNSPFTPYDAWRVSNTTEFESALEVFASQRAILNFRVLYFSTQGINLLLVTLRLMKLMHFQPRLGTITRTLADATPELFHFFIIAGIIFISFAFFAHVVFGRLVNQFHTVGSAINTCFRIILGNDNAADYLFELKGWELVAGTTFWWSFIVVLALVVFNVLIAIVLNAYNNVKKDEEKSHSIPEEIFLLGRNMVKAMYGGLSYRKQILKLESLGAVSQADEGGRMKRSIFRESSFVHSLSNDRVRVADRSMNLEELESLIFRVFESTNEEGNKSTERKQLVEAIYYELWKDQDGEDESMASNVERKGEKVSNSAEREILEKLDILKSAIQDSLSVELFNLRKKVEEMSQQMGFEKKAE